MALRKNSLRRHFSLLGLSSAPSSMVSFESAATSGDGNASSSSPPRKATQRKRTKSRWRKLSFSGFTRSDKCERTVAERSLSLEEKTTTTAESLFRENGINNDGNTQQDKLVLCTTDKLRQVCHHSDCQDRNQCCPLLLCEHCDMLIHSDSASNGHLRFALHSNKSSNLTRHTSTCSLPNASVLKALSDDEGAQCEDNGHVNNREDPSDSLDLVLNLRLKRKKALKGRRYHTEGAHSQRRGHVRPTILPQAHHCRSRSLHDDQLGGATKHRPPHSPDATTSSSMLLSYRNCANSVDAMNKQNQLEMNSEQIGSAIYRTSDDCANEHIATPVRKVSPLNSDAGDSSPPPVEGAYHKHVLGTIADDESEMDVFANRASAMSIPNMDATISPDRCLHSSRKVSAPIRLYATGREKEVTPRKYSLGMECFTLKFDLLTQPEIEIVAAVRGVSLREAIYEALEKRQINIDSVSVFLASSNTALPLDADCFPLGGNHLHVKAKENNEALLTLGQTTGNRNSKLKYSSQKDKRGRRPGTSTADDSASMTSDTSPYSSLTGADSQRLMKATKNQSKFRPIFASFAKTPDVQPNDRHEQLQEQLRHYCTAGLPPMPSLLTIGQRTYPEQTFYMESHWTQVVSGCEKLSKRERDQQEAIWELLNTEVEYIKKLKVIIDVFLSSLINLQNESLLNEIETEKMFSNITDIYQVNCAFWEENLLRVINRARETKHMLDPSMLKDAFMQFEDIFHPYTRYCLEQKSLLEYIRDKYKENEMFKMYITWAEAQKPCNRLKVHDLVVMPMQRLTKYKLLLKAILKKTESDDHKKDLIHMIQRVDEFVVKVNTTLHQKQEHERLSMIIDRIEVYDVIDFPNEECTKYMSDFCKFDLTCPIPGCPQQRRNLLLEGSLKLKDSFQKADVYCFLFTDMILVTKPNKRGDKVKVIKPPMRLDKVVIQPLRDGGSFALAYLNEYHVASAVYIFYGESRIWLEKIEKAQEAYKQMRTAAVDQSELCLMYLDSDGDDDLSLFTSQLAYDAADYRTDQERAVSRVDSTDSVDTFLATTMTANSTENLVRSQSDEGVPASSPEVATNDESDARPRSLTCPAKPAVHPKPPVKPKPCLKNRQTANTVAGGVTAEGGAAAVAVAAADEGGNTSRLAQRRATRAERRYHTADAIEDLRRKQRRADTSIHKRLSWNLVDTSDTKLAWKACSTDSLRSAPSSSGVSSTASLHAGPDICEEASDDTALTSDAKSMPDISQLGLALTGALQDGIASVALPCNEGHRLQLTHAQIVRMTKQLLLNSTLEASEV